MLVADWLSNYQPNSIKVTLNGIGYVWFSMGIIVEVKKV